jgi:hypothetical protein
VDEEIVARPPSSVLARDLAERALWTALQALLPFLALAISATSWGSLKVIGMSALAAVGAALLALVKGLVAQHFTGTASSSREVSQTAVVVSRPHPGPRNEPMPPPPPIG